MEIRRLLLGLVLALALLAPLGDAGPACDGASPEVADRCPGDGAAAGADAAPVVEATATLQPSDGRSAMAAAAGVAREASVEAPPAAAESAEERPALRAAAPLYLHHCAFLC